MKKKILTQIMVLSFAVGGLFVVGNNVLADDTQPIELGPITITCSQHPGYNAQCWKHDLLYWNDTGHMCIWTGNQSHFCAW